MIKQFDTRSEQAIALSAQVASELQDALDDKDRAVLAVAGGSTPKEFFKILSQEVLDWASITIIPTDERFVDENSDRSNARLIKTSLMINNAAAAQYCPLFVNTDTPDAAVTALGPIVAPHIPLDVCILGMGTDMHTASIFPTAPNVGDLLSSDAPNISPVYPQGGEEPRITLTAPVLNSASVIHVLLTGEDKKAALENAFTIDDPRKAPIKSILSHKHVDIYYAE